jgi:hypothetical protein
VLRADVPACRSLLERALGLLDQAVVKAPADATFAMRAQIASKDLVDLQIAMQDWAAVRTLVDQRVRYFPGGQVWGHTSGALLLARAVREILRGVNGKLPKERDDLDVDLARRALADTMARRAVELLEESLRLGFNDTSQVRAQPELRVLADREDYKRVLAAMETAAASRASRPAVKR